MTEFVELLKYTMNGQYLTFSKPGADWTSSQWPLCLIHLWEHPIEILPNTEENVNTSKLKLVNQIELDDLSCLRQILYHSSTICHWRFTISSYLAMKWVFFHGAD